MTVVERKPAPVYEVSCWECGSKIHYKACEVIGGFISCPVCGVAIMPSTIQRVKTEEPAMTIRLTIVTEPDVPASVLRENFLEKMRQVWGMPITLLPSYPDQNESISLENVELTEEGIDR